MVERAGYGWLKYSAITALTSANWPRLVRYRPTRATSSSEPPAASQTAPGLSHARLACAAMSPATSSPVAGSIGIWQDMETVSPQRTACEYGPMAAGALSVWMGWRMAVGPGFGIKNIIPCLPSSRAPLESDDGHTPSAALFPIPNPESPIPAPQSRCTPCTTCSQTGRAHV